MLLCNFTVHEHFQGDYSSITTRTQNDAVRALVALKGFCLDCVHKLPSWPLVQFVIDYLEDHGTDISTPEKLNAWIRENPDKCALPENHARTLVRSLARSGRQKRKDRFERSKNQYENGAAAGRRHDSVPGFPLFPQKEEGDTS